MKGKIKGCTHHETKVLKMAGGGTVPGKIKTMGPPNVKELQKKVDKNPDGSQQYVRGKNTSEKLRTLNELQEGNRKRDEEASDKVRRTLTGERFDEAKYREAAKERDKMLKITRSNEKSFLAEIDRKYGK